MKIQVFGSGCRSCTQLVANAQRAIDELGLGIPVEKVEDLREIVKLGVMATPALVIDGKVRVVGKVLTSEAVKALLRV